jgi:tRNA(His) 5'-end guanylyltransferase
MTHPEAAVDGDEFEVRLRRGEWFRDQTLPPGMWSVLRVDGRAFTLLTEDRFEKPYDWRVLEHMVDATRSLLTDVGGVYGYTQSDEVSVLLPPSFEGFGRRVEALASLAASAASARFSVRAGFPAQFAARVWVGAGMDDVVDYFTWRQADAARSALDQWAFWTLRRAGHDPRTAAAALEGLGTAEKNDLLLRHGVTFNEVPTWQRRGVALYYRAPAAAPGAPPGRPRLHEETDLTSRDEYRAFVRAVVEATV